MPRNLTEPMKRVLRIMAGGSAIEPRHASGIDCHWVYVPPSDSPADSAARPHANTVWALERRGLIEPIEYSNYWPFYHLLLTEAGRRAAEELG